MELPALSEKCPECGGTGYFWIKPGEFSGKPEGGETICGVCDGKQRIPTEDGQALLDFLSQFGGEE